MEQGAQCFLSDFELCSFHGLCLRVVSLDCYYGRRSSKYGVAMFVPSKNQIVLFLKMMAALE